MTLDREAALEYLREFRDGLVFTRSVRDHDPSLLGTDIYRDAEAWLLSMVIGAQRVAAAVDPDLAPRLVPTTGRQWAWLHSYETTLLLIGTLEQEERVDAVFAPRGPSISASRLHPWVWEAAARLWDDGHTLHALQAAATAIDIQLQAKLGREDTSGSDLVSQAFSLKPPTATEPRLRFAEYVEGTDNFKSAHEGAGAFGRGCMMRIRNLATHATDELEEQVALEQLAALSVLARWIDGAELLEAYV